MTDEQFSEMERVRNPSTVDRAISAVAWYLPEILVLVTLLVLGLTVWTPWIVVAALGIPLRVAYALLQRDVGRMPSATTSGRTNRHQERAQEPTDEGEVA